MKLEDPLLHTLIKQNKMQELKDAINSASDLEAKDYLYFTPLHLACYHGLLEIVELLLEKGANVHSKSVYQHTPLQIATLSSSRNCPSIISTLLKHSARIDVPDYIGNTALHLATKSGKTGIVMKLIKKGANVNARNNDGRAPLHFAAKSGFNKITEFLVKNGAFLGIKDNKGLSPSNLANENWKFPTNVASVE